MSSESDHVIALHARNDFIVAMVHVGAGDDQWFLMLTYASIHFNPHVSPSKPLFRPKTQEACSDVPL